LEQGQIKKKKKIWSNEGNHQPKKLNRIDRIGTLYRTSSVPLFLFRSASCSRVISISSPSPVPTVDPRRRDKAFIGQSRSRFVSAKARNPHADYDDRLLLIDLVWREKIGTL
jgi:hypothetical protein